MPNMVEGILQLDSDGKGLLVITALLSCTLLLSLFFYLQKPASHKLPPGPLALPVIGHLHLLGLQPHRSLAQMSLRYGPLFSIKLGSVPLVVASSPEAARQILHTFDQAFANRAPLVGVNHVFGTYTGMTFSQPGPYMRFIRHLFATELFSFHCLERFKPIRTDEVRALLRSVYAGDTISTSAAENCIPDQEVEIHTSQASPPVASKLINIRPMLQLTANNIIARMAMGETASVALQPVLETLEAMSNINVSDFFPWIHWADLQGCQKRCKQTGLKMHRVLQQIIEERREKRGGMYEPPADILDILLSAALTCPKDLQLVDAHIRAILLDIFAGGSDPTALVIEWVMADLLANPIEMKKTQEEIENVVSRKSSSSQNMVEEADIQNMPYLEAVVKESMRLHPVLPLLIPRQAGHASRVMGFDIPAKTRVFVNVWAIGRDPKVWDRPDEFCPQRFLGCNIDARGQHFEFLPFGAGRRACPGLKLGLISVHIIVASLLRMFFWTPHDVGHDMSEKSGIITAKARPLVARATPKLASEFYY